MKDIKNILNFKRPFILLLNFLLAVFLLTAVTLLTDPKSKNTPDKDAAGYVTGVVKTDALTSENQSINDVTDLSNVPPGGESYVVGKYEKSLNFLYTTKIVSKNIKKLLDQIVYNLELTSSIEKGIRIDTLEDYWDIKIQYNMDIGEEEYYLYQKGGVPYIQAAKSNLRKEVPLKDYGILICLLKPDADVMRAVNKNLYRILDSPLFDGNAADYLSHHTEECENIRKLGDSALYYMLSCFYKGEGDTLKGSLMMYLCEDILGNRSYGVLVNATPTGWYRNLYIRPETVLPDFIYQGDDKILKLVYETETRMHHKEDSGLTIVAPHLFEYYEEGDSLKIFATTLYNYYKLYGDTLTDLGGGVTPSAMTFQKKEDSSYVLIKYEQATDGSYFYSSIKAYCIMPLSGKKIPGLAKEILYHYENYTDLLSLRDNNLKEYLREHELENLNR